MACCEATASRSKHFASLNSLAIELPPSVVESLNQFEEIEFVSVDSDIRPFGGHVAHTTGADNVRSMATTGALDGTGIGIAIIDSGIYPAHVAFLEAAGSTRSRIVKSVDFTGEIAPMILMATALTWPPLPETV